MTVGAAWEPFQIVGVYTRHDAWRLDRRHLEVEATLEDAGTFTKPWKQRSAWYLAPSDDVLEYVCSENSSDPKHMTVK